MAAPKDDRQLGSTAVRAAEDASRSYGAGWRRAPLRDQLPLDTPLSVMIDPVNACNFRCVFCPTGDPELLRAIGRPSGQMSRGLFSKLVSDLRAFPRQVRVLHLYKDGEPLVNRHLPEMIALAKARGAAERVELTTNAALLDEERARALLEAGLDGVRVSVCGADDRTYRHLTRTTTRYESVRANVAGLFRLKQELRPGLHLHAKILDTGLTEHQKQAFLADFGPITDSTHIDTIMGMGNPLGRDFSLGLQPRTGMRGRGTERAVNRKVCSEPFMKLVVAFNGDVCVCCADYAHATVVGNAARASLVDLWRSDALRRFRQQHLEGRRGELEACRDCDYVLGLSPAADLDEQRERLLPLYAEPPG